MRTAIPVALLAVLASGCFMPASIQNRVNERDRERYRAEAAAAWRERDRILGERGWVPAGAAQEGRLVERYNESDRIPVTLPSTGRFTLIGICGDNCLDMDLVVYNSARQRVAADLEPDSRPAVAFSGRAGERFTVLVTIPNCRRPRAQPGMDDPTWDCIYNTKLYTQR
jgi:hypothetical protein